MRVRGHMVTGVVVVVITPRAAPRENPEDGVVTIAEDLRVFVLVSAYRAGFLHLADALPTSGLATQERPAHLGNPAMHCRSLMVMTATASILLLIAQVAVLALL